jgi:hypothetical protein
MKLRGKIGRFLSKKLGTETVLDITSKLILESSDIKIALDIGSGEVRGLFLNFYNNKL